ncbi:PAS domain S-box protein [Halobaculum rubrum]|uniref:PAS domain S-box protein n=1 Tax=Halobaculum rubrum TaxID=2872158 RepID=UPI001CA42D56|nr:PAS domain S-box protein [Halobaculum rubrum]QZX98435.1 PAS domain S-box protein [Halobaculum rubrum]
MFHVPHFVADVAGGMGLLTLLTGAAFPLTLAVAIAVAGYWCLRCGLSAPEVRRAAIWFVLGTVGMTVVAGAMVAYQLLKGANLLHLHFVILNFATAGGLGGFVIGWYDAKNQRRRNELRVFREVVEHAGHSICLTDPDGTIEYVNGEFATQTGYDREQALGANPGILRSGVQDEAFYEEMWSTIRAGDVWHGELVNEHRDGTTYHIDQTIAPVFDDGGEIEHFIGINKDITARKEYEAELERQNERLDEFASVVSHDLRNPLTVASGRVELERAERDSDHLDTAINALERMERLIDDMLALARQGEAVGETQTVSLGSVSEAAWKQVETAGAELSVETELSIEGDPHRVQQLIENLFRNAVEHGTADGQSATGDAGDDPELRVTVGDLDDGFFVEDTGQGLPDDDRDSIFESGYTTSEDGTGLGLAIVRRIAVAHGWETSATNGPSGGARFEVTAVNVVRATTKSSAVA